MMNDFKLLPLQCKVIRYADGIAFFYTFSPEDYDKFENIVRQDMKNIDRFHQINGMAINPSKSKFMVVHQRSQAHLIRRENIKINNSTEIEQVKKFKYLGVIIDENASMDEHVNELKSRITPVVNILSRLKWTIPKHVLLKIYLAHFHSHLYYAPSIYGVISKEKLSEIQVLQNRAIKHIYRLPVLTSTSDVFKSIDILPIKGVIFHATVSLVNKIEKKLISSNINFPKMRNNRRSDGNFEPIKFTSDFLKRDLTFHGVQLYNSLPEEIKKSPSHESFKGKVKKFLLSRTSQLLNLCKLSLLELS